MNNHDVGSGNAFINHSPNTGGCLLYHDHKHSVKIMVSYLGNILFTKMSLSTLHDLGNY